MTSIITGDIINSRDLNNQDDWITPLKSLFAAYGTSPKTWEIYRGDSFQLEIIQPEESLLAAIRIKACIKSIKGLDVRMAIGIGEKNYDAARITESNGNAFIYSGEKFESLKKIRQNIALQSPWPRVDTEINLMLSLASIAMDKWSASSAEMVMLSLQHKALVQKELGAKLQISQSSISERQKRAHYDEILALVRFYKRKIKKRLA